MNILVIEDEASIQERIVRLTKRVLGDELKEIWVSDSLEEGQKKLNHSKIDVLLLDLNLNGKDGFEVLRSFVVQHFHTIVISAHTDRAIEAYDLGVADFITKPFDEDRLKKAFDRVIGRSKEPRQHFTKFLAVRKFGVIELIDLERVNFIQADGGYSQLHLLDGKQEMHDKMLKDICAILPPSFHRVHKSYVVNMQEIRGIQSSGSHKHHLVMQNGARIPLSRSKYKTIKASLNL